VRACIDRRIIEHLERETLLGKLWSRRDQ
jgi:hypothetical protein